MRIIKYQLVPDSRPTPEDKAAETIPIDSSNISEMIQKAGINASVSVDHVSGICEISTPPHKKELTEKQISRLDAIISSMPQYLDKIEDGVEK